VRLIFLGTGASGGTPGRGRSRRGESSLLVEARGARVLIDCPRRVARLRLGPLLGVLVTHRHRDAAGGLSLLATGAPVFAPPAPRVVALGALTAARLVVPHAPGVTTYAWRLAGGGRTIVYASDVARLTPALARFAAGADVLVIDGAMWRRTLYTHLRIDEALPRLCRWPVGAILLTQIGRSAPPHARLAEEVAAICPRARPAWDGLVWEVA
jgi:ribonuclease BN (tRNA processing enzyme)